jgi:hypothetical protein
VLDLDALLAGIDRQIHDLTIRERLETRIADPLIAQNGD